MNALVSVASVSAVAVPLPSMPGLSPSIALSHPDAELLALGTRYDALAAQHEATQEASEPHWAELSRIFRELRPTLSSDLEAFEAAERLSPLPVPNCDDLMEMMGPVSRAIMDASAHTPEGLAVKARLVLSECSRCFEAPDDDADWDHLAIRSLVRAVLEMSADSKAA